MDLMGQPTGTTESTASPVGPMARVLSRVGHRAPRPGTVAASLDLIERQAAAIAKGRKGA